MGNRAGGRRTGPKCIAIVGPFASGKTTLLEAILARTGRDPQAEPGFLGQYGRRPFRRSQGACHERRGDRRHHRIHGRIHHLRRLPGLGRVRLRVRAGAGRLRPGGGGRRGRRKEDPGAAADHAQARRARHSAHPVPQQDRQDGGRRARHAEAAAADQRGAAAAAADPAAQGRHRRRLDRPGAGARLHLPGVCRERNHRDPRRREGARDRGAVLDAGDAGRP